MEASAFVFLLTTLIFLFLLTHSRSRNNPAGRLPPGPPSLVFLAKFLATRRSIFDQGPLLHELHQHYGPVISLRLAGTLLVFVADRRLAHRVLVQDGTTFADRTLPIDPATRLFTTGGRTVGTAPYSDYWRLVRRNLVGALQPARVAASASAAAMRWACDGLLESVCHQSAAVEGNTVTLRPLLRRSMFRLLLAMCFGTEIGDDALGEIESLQQRALISVTSFPIFAFLPAVTKRVFRHRWEANLAVRRRQEELLLPLINATCRTDGNASNARCYAESLHKLRVLEDGSDRPLTDAEKVTLCFEFLGAGTDTTMSLIEWIMAELVNHPDIQAKVRAEVRNTPSGELGGGKYIKAVVLEGLRLHPPGHFLIPHGVLTDGAEIGGYAVPRGADVNFLLSYMGRDDTVWMAARDFRPERFLDGEGREVDITGSREIMMMPFGAGRRMCPGYKLGMHHAACFVASMVKDLEWLPAVGCEVVDMEEHLEFTVVLKEPLAARIIVAD